jgi:hypothetical protein
MLKVEHLGRGINKNNSTTQNKPEKFAEPRQV